MSFPSHAKSLGGSADSSGEARSCANQHHTPQPPLSPTAHTPLSPTPNILSSIITIWGARLSLGSKLHPLSFPLDQHPDIPLVNQGRFQSLPGTDGQLFSKHHLPPYPHPPPLVPLHPPTHTHTRIPLNGNNLTMISKENSEFQKLFLRKKKNGLMIDAEQRC